MLKCRVKSMMDDIQCYQGISLSKKDLEDCILLIKDGGAIKNLKTAEEELPLAKLVAIKRAGARHRWSRSHQTVSPQLY